VSEEDGVSRTFVRAGADTVQAMAPGDLRHAPIKKLVRRIRSETGRAVPDAGPHGPGVNACVLVVLRDPSRLVAQRPKILSPLENADCTASNQRRLLMDSIGSTLIDIRRENLGSGSTPTTLSQHEAVLERIAAHDPVGARKAMSAHLGGVTRWWREHAVTTTTAPA
jgi:FCD domain